MNGNAEEAFSFGLLYLPTELIEKILSYMTYDEISFLRRTCHGFNTVASGCLNKGFSKADRLHATIQREVKAKLPRRESERRNHPLARHVDILSAVETRLSLLSMTYSKYIEIGLCCFIPGKVLDEIYRVLRSVRVNPNPPRAHELLQELRDISSMAMEHFDEKIVPSLKMRMPSSPELRLILSSGSSSHAAGASTMAAPSLFKFRGVMGGTQQLDMATASHCHQPNSSLEEQRKQLRQLRAEMRRHLAARDVKIAELSRKVADQDRKLVEQDRRVAEHDQRFNDIMAEFTRVRATDSGTAVGPPAKSSKCGLQSASSSISCSEAANVRPIVLQKRPALTHRHGKISRPKLDVHFLSPVAEQFDDESEDTDVEQPTMPATDELQATTVKATIEAKAGKKKAVDGAKTRRKADERSFPVAAEGAVTKRHELVDAPAVAHLLVPVVRHSLRSGRKY